MHAIILVAGMGKRLGNLIAENTKCMIKVNGHTLVERLLTQLSTLHLFRIVLVISYKGEKLRTQVRDRVTIEYLLNMSKIPCTTR